MGVMIFNGVSTEELGLIIQSKPTYTFPENEYSTVHIPGRNGDIIIDTGAFKNVTRTYNIACVFKKGSGFITNANDIITWLKSVKGYARLEDSYEPDYFRMASFVKSGELSNFYDTATVVEAEFECKPERYLKMGDEESVFTSEGESEMNPTGYTSQPELIFSYTSGHIEETTDSTEDTVNDISQTIKLIDTASNTEYEIKIEIDETDATEYEIHIDGQTMECYYYKDGKITSANSYVTLSNGFPKISGYSKLKLSSDNTYTGEIRIIPRWWTI